MPPVHWIIQENQGDSDTVRRMVSALESDRHVPHLVWLTKSLDVPPIPDLPDDVVIVCHGQGFTTRALSTDYFSILRNSDGPLSVLAGRKRCSLPMVESCHYPMRGTSSEMER